MLFPKSKKIFFFYLNLKLYFFSPNLESSKMGSKTVIIGVIPLISNPINLLNSEASLKYFLTQSIASINFLFAIILNLFLMKNFFMNNFISILINSSLLMKMGSAPFHMWFPNIMEGLSWLNCFILMTWQKISPMILLSYYFNMNFLMFIMIFNVIIGAIGGFNQSSLRKLMAFSSINNLGWMLSALLISENLWMTYFFLYSFFISIMCFLFYMLNIFYINQMFNFNINLPMKLAIMINFLSLGGLPPFLGFFPKWLIINFLILNKLYIISFFFIMMSLIMLIFYIRIIYSSFMFFSFKFKWFKIFIKNNFMIWINFFSFLSLLGMIFSTLFFYLNL
uniref:NADH-ubiquinone oxidoreductase chain 2 n=1 Tax=Callerebia suroia TaxID=698779 RepID=A0A0A7AIW4_9NEOP|nr:NADH dehydrogenase subunit 2 [Callerebia suroia]AHH92945.1 NADH dehydrogenase subunit 2 [Callerebia suroia]